jgi:RNA polymerase sigma factor (sigma-70 family)
MNPTWRWHDGPDDDMSINEAQLLLAAHTDPAAFRELYDRYGARVHRYHLRRTGNQNSALDLTAETFAQAWLCRKRFRDEAGGSVGPWLFAIARHVLLRSVRRRRMELSACARLGVLERLDREPTDIRPDDTWLEGLDEALDDLPEEQRRAVTMRVVDDLGYDEIAGHLDTSEQVARARVSRGIRQLRNQLIESREAL